MKRDFEAQADDQYTRSRSAVEANLARYVFDDTGQVRGRCRGHDRGEHHPLCPDQSAEVYAPPKREEN